VGNTSNFIGSIASIIIGILLAFLTIMGLINSQVNSPGSNPVNVERPVIDYGQNG